MVFNWKRINKTKSLPLTPAYGQWRLKCISQVFAPAFTLSLCDSEYARKPPVPIASVVMGQCEKQEDKVLRMKSLWRTVRFSTWKDFLVLTGFWLRTAFAGGQFLADFKGKDFWLLALRLRQLRTESIEKYKTADKNRFWLLDFSHLRAESAFRQREKN